MRRVLQGDVRVTLSKLEDRFLGRLRESGLLLPRPTARPVGGAWTAAGPTVRLTVELNGYRYHHTRHPGKDRRREREARARGDEFRRYTYADVFEEPRLMLAELRGLLGSPSSVVLARAEHG